MKMTPKKYAEILISLLEETASPKQAIRNFLTYLQRKKHFKFLNKILIVFEKEWNRRKNISSAEIFGPKKYTAAAEAFAKNLQTQLKKKIDYKFHEDDKLIGGFKVHLDDYLLDASLKSKLTMLSSTLSS